MIFLQVFLQLAENFPKILKEYSKDFTQAINFLMTGWTAYTKNKNSLVLRIELSAVGRYVRTLGFIFFCIDSPTGYLRR